MAKQRSHNSILILTTLGVYLGLVLVGATPQIVAQRAAMARSFDITDEREAKDELDRKPDEDTKKFSEAIHSYLEELGEFLGDLRRLHQIDKFNSGYNSFHFASTNYQPCPETGGMLSEETADNFDRWLKPAIVDARYRTENWGWLSECIPTDKFLQANRASATVSAFKVDFDKVGFAYQVSIKRSSPESANALLAGLRAALELAANELDGEKLFLHKHTSLSASDNQIFIVTRLPRGSLDSLLAQGAE